MRETLTVKKLCRDDVQLQAILQIDVYSRGSRSSFVLTRTAMSEKCLMARFHLEVLLPGNLLMFILAH